MIDYSITKSKMKSYKLEEVFEKIYGDGSSDGLKKTYESLKKQYDSAKKIIEEQTEIIKKETERMRKLKQIMDMYKSDKTNPLYIEAEKEYKSAKRKIDEPTTGAKAKIKEQKETLKTQRIKGKIDKAQKELEEMIELLAQDPTINQALIEETKKAYNQKILAKSQRAAEAEENNTKIVGELLGKDKSDRRISDAFKNLKNKNKPMKKRVGVTAAEQADFDAAVTDVMTKINSKYKTRLTKADIVTLLDASEAGELTEDYVIKKLENIVERSKKERTALEEARDKRVALIEGKAKSNLSDADKAKIASNEAEISKLDTDIAIKEGTAKYGEMKTLMDKLKSKGVIVPEMIPELEDSSSEIYKAYEKFVAASEKVREAFAKAKTDPDNRNIAEIDNAAAEYKVCCDEMKRLTGFGAAEWQNYLNREINDGKRSIEGKEDIYNHTDNKELNALDGDRRIKKSPQAKIEYDKLKDKTEEIDKDQQSLLETGELPSGETAKTVFSKNIDYAATMSNLEARGIPVKSILSKTALVKLGGIRGRLANIKNMIVDRFGKKKAQAGKLPEKYVDKDAEDLLDEYEGKTDSDKKDYRDSQRLRAKKGRLEAENSSIRASAPKSASQIEQTDLDIHVDANRGKLGKLAEDIER